MNIEINEEDKKVIAVLFAQIYANKNKLEIEQIKRMGAKRFFQRSSKFASNHFKDGIETYTNWKQSDRYLDVSYEPIERMKAFGKFWIEQYDGKLGV